MEPWRQELEKNHRYFESLEGVKEIAEEMLQQQPSDQEQWEGAREIQVRVGGYFELPPEDIDIEMIDEPPADFEDIFDCADRAQREPGTEQQNFWARQIWEKARAIKHRLGLDLETQQESWGSRGSSRAMSQTAADSTSVEPRAALSQDGDTSQGSDQDSENERQALPRWLKTAEHFISESLQSKEAIGIASHHEALTWQERGRIQMEQHDFKQAEASFLESLKIQRDNDGKAESLKAAEALLCIGLAILKPDWERDLFQKSLDIQRSIPCAKEKKHDLEETLGNLKDAVSKQGKKFQEFQFGDCQVPAQSNEAAALNEQGMEKFATFFKFCLQNCPLSGFGRAMAWRALAIVKKCQENFEESASFIRESLEELRRWQDADSELLKLAINVLVAERGMVRARQGDFKEAESSFAGCFPDIPDYAAGIANALQGNMEEAKIYFKQCLRDMPNDHERRLFAVVLHEIGIVQRKQEKWHEAQILFEECLKVEPVERATSFAEIQSITSTLHELGIAMRQVGNSQEAREHFEKSHDMQKKLADKSVRSEEAFHREWLGIIRGARGKLQKAKLMLRASRKDSLNIRYEISTSSDSQSEPVQVDTPEILWIQKWLDRFRGDSEQQDPCNGETNGSRGQDLGAAAVLVA